MRKLLPTWESGHSCGLLELLSRGISHLEPARTPCMSVLSAKPAVDSQNPGELLTPLLKTFLQGDSRLNLLANAWLLHQLALLVSALWLPQRGCHCQRSLFGAVSQLPPLPLPDITPDSHRTLLSTLPYSKKKNVGHPSSIDLLHDSISIFRDFVCTLGIIMLTLLDHCSPRQGPWPTHLWMPGTW